MIKNNQGISSGQVIVGITIVAVFVLVITFFIKSSAFDSSGGFIKDMADDKDMIRYQSSAVKFDYLKIITDIEEDTNNYKNHTKHHYNILGVVTDVKIKSNKQAEYIVGVMAPEKDEYNLLKMYGLEKPKDNKVIRWDISVGADKEYNNFDIGDKVRVYGEIDKPLKVKDSYTEYIPRVNAKKIQLEKVPKLD